MLMRAFQSGLLIFNPHIWSLLVFLLLINIISFDFELSVLLAEVCWTKFSCSQEILTEGKTLLRGLFEKILRSPLSSCCRGHRRLWGVGAQEPEVCWAMGWTALSVQFLRACLGLRTSRWDQSLCGLIHKWERSVCSSNLLESACHRVNAQGNVRMHRALSRLNWAPGNSEICATAVHYSS